MYSASLNRSLPLCRSLITNSLARNMNDFAPEVKTELKAPSPARPPRLLDQVRHLCRLKHHSLRTEQTYVDWIRRFILFHGKRHPKDMGAEEAHQYLEYLAVRRHVAASTQNQALNALVFLY